MTKLLQYKIIHPPPHNQLFNNHAFTSSSDDEPVLVPGRYIVVFKDQGEREVSEQAAQRAAELTESVISDLNIRQDSLIHRYRYSLKGFSARLSEEQAEALKQDSRIKLVVQDFRYKAIQSSLFPLATQKTMGDTIPEPIPQIIPWGVERVGGPFNGTGKRAWVLDTGIKLNQSQLNVDTQNAANFVTHESQDDLSGHGTFVTGIIAAKDNDRGVVGVAAGATVVPVKVCDQGGYSLASHVNAGVDYVAGNFAPGDVANMSLAWPLGDPFIDLPIELLEGNIETAASAGLRFTIAAGNDMAHAEDYSPARITHQNVWTLSSISEGDNLSYSFTCPENNHEGTNGGAPPIDYAAPGNEIKSYASSSTDITTACGTSFAAPHMAGLLLTEPNGIGTDGFTGYDAFGSQHPIVAFMPTLSAPYIFASVYDNYYPRISWSTVAYADNYRVYRRIDQGSWQYIGQVSNPPFTDYTQGTSNLSVIFSPPANGQDYLSYRVKAAASGLDNSPNSNTVYFSTSGFCNPCQ